jgi:hypothetical protein
MSKGISSNRFVTYWRVLDEVLVEDDVNVESDKSNTSGKGDSNIY